MDRSELHLTRDCDRETLRRRMSSGELVRLRRGAFVRKPSTEPGSAELRDKALLTLHAVESTLTAPHAFSHGSAALLWGLTLWRLPKYVHLRQAYRAGGMHSADVKRHIGLPDVAEVRQGVPVTTLSASVVDCVRSMPPLAGLVVADCALHHGLSRTRLACDIAEVVGTRGLARAKRILTIADAGAESPWETWVRFQVLQIGLPPPITQFPVEADGHTYRLDLYWPEHRVWLEFDGANKYDDNAYGSGKSGRQVLLEEKRREDEITSVLGVRPLRVMATASRHWPVLRSRILARFPEHVAQQAQPQPWMLAGSSDY